jgi:hypothetical protein
MWIGQGKPAIPGDGRFVQQTYIILSNFWVDLKVQSTHYDKSRPDRIFTRFLSIKIVEYEPQTR